MRVPAFLQRAEVTIEPYLGRTAHGPKFGPPRKVRVQKDERRRLVRSTEGEQVISTVTLLGDPGIECPLGSRVTIDGVQHTAEQVIRPAALLKATHSEILLVG